MSGLTITSGTRREVTPVNAAIVHARHSKSYAKILVLFCSLLLAGLVTRAETESIPLVLTEGDSKILHFRTMQRVATIDPQVADVIVSNLNELVVVGRGAGRTKIYVWDKQGRHDYAVVVKPRERAQDVVQQLRELLPPNLRYNILDNQTLLLQGEVPSLRELERIEQIAAGIAKQVRIINLIEVQDAELSGAQRQATVLRRILGEEFQYVVWDENTLMVMGQVESEAELQQLAQVVLAGSTSGVTVANLVTLGSPWEPAPAGEIAQALGPSYHVWPLYGRTVVIEGLVPDAAAKERADRLLAAFEPRAQIVNLIQVAEAPGLSLHEQRELLQSALGDNLQVRTVADRALVVEGTVATEAELEDVKQVVALFAADSHITNLVKMVAPEKRQILVKARIIDVRTTALQRLGITWGEMRAGDLGTPNYSWLVQTEGGVDNVYPIGARLNALAQNNEARILAQPNLLVNDGEAADILVGGEVPIPVPSTGVGGTAITIDYKPYGVTLDIETQIEGEDRVRLTVTTEVSDIDTSQTVVIAGIGVPAFRTRRVTTTVDVVSGATLAIGGLIQSDQTKVVSKVPFLGDLPIIGSLFRSREFTEGESELVILVTPEIVTAE